MQTLLTDIELDVRELKYLIEVVRHKPELCAVTKRRIAQTRNRLELLSQRLDEMDLPATTLSPEETLQKAVAVEEKKPDAVQEPESLPIINPAEPKIVPGKPGIDLRSSMSLNDSFRFSRELFGGDSKQMNHILTQISGMNSFDEAFAFLSDKWSVEEDSEAVTDFMEMLRKYFV